MSKFINVLILLGAASFLITLADSYWPQVFIWGVYRSITYWRFSMGCLAFAAALTLLQIRDKK